MNPISTSLSHSFEQQVRRRGQHLLWERAVSIKSGDAWHVSARVKGTQTYTVKLERKDRVIEGVCTCPYFEGEGPCKHVWAVILAADSRSYLQGTGKSPKFHYEHPVAGKLFDFELEGELPLEGSKTPAEVVPQRPPPWAGQLETLRLAQSVHVPADGVVRDRERDIYYVIDLRESIQSGLSIHVLNREKTQSGAWGKLKSLAIVRDHISQLPPEVRQTLHLFSGIASQYGYEPYHVPSSYRLRGPITPLILAKLCETNRLLLRKEPDDAFADLEPLAWDPAPWKFRVRFDKKESAWAATGSILRDGVELPLDEPYVLFEDGVVFLPGKIAPLDHGGSFPWVAILRRDKQILVPNATADEFVTEVMTKVPTTVIDWPQDLKFEEVQLPMQPRVRFLEPDRYAFAYGYRPATTTRAELAFGYGNLKFTENMTGRGMFDPRTRTFVIRDPLAEEGAREVLRENGFKPPRPGGDTKTPVWEVANKRFPIVVRQLVQAGWHVEAEGKVFRQHTGYAAKLTSGIDWFDLEAKIDFGSESVSLPELLSAVKHGEKLVRLGDGTFGMLPEELLARYGNLLQFAQEKNGEVRFHRSQAGLLDVFLAELPEVDTDAVFQKAREQMRGFAGLVPCEQPPGFQGTLRDYQRLGLAWMRFLRDLGFGGCLADDMGVGKTPQVLAMLEAERGKGTSLIVVPRSLIYNWTQEGARFAPELRILDHAHAARFDDLEEFKAYDVVLTTYGILRRDALKLKDFEFHYAILDEAQAIKNAASESARSARLLRARHRLALSGTPIENHLGKLWSLFEFLNPGMLGAAKVFQPVSASTRTLDEESRQVLSRALRPFMLRRTKAQVARELPDRIEQTIYCELDTAQRTLYDELRDHYRSKLLGKAGKGFSGKSKIQVLEALLRLRQAACHPALIDSAYVTTPSAKLEELTDKLEQISGEGHKSLVFSQFTSFLAIVKKRLDEEGISYSYLDGSTRNRQAVVEEFQNEPDRRVFLISLKAGGVGLNLTAAEYVFLLDPWWNPAVEAQAIDRAHRMGQQRNVFAYRLIARDTVEERVLDLQKSKRDLAEAIIGEDNRLIGNLSPDDLDLLLS